MIDTHAHLDFFKFDKDREEVIQRAFDSGVEKIINIGSDLKGSKASVELAEKYENIYAAVGVHPHDVGDLSEDKLNELMSSSGLTRGSRTNKEELDSRFRGNDRERRKNNKVVAIGEIGLDYFKSKTPKDLQIKWFVSQLDLAKELDLPVVIHCRDAHDDVKKILQSKIPLNPPFPKGEKEKSLSPKGEIDLKGEIEKTPRPKGEGLRGVIHCFSGNLADANFYINLGLYISFTGVITYTDEYDEVIKNIPLEKILIETDCPFLSPVPMRGKRNEPSFVKYVAQKIADVRNISIKEVEEETAKNAENLFAL